MVAASTADFKKTALVRRGLMICNFYYFCSGVEFESGRPKPVPPVEVVGEVGVVVPTVPVPPRPVAGFAGCIGGWLAINDWPDFACMLDKILGMPKIAATATMMMPRISGIAANGELAFLVVVVVLLVGKSLTNFFAAVGLAVGLAPIFGDGETSSFTLSFGDGEAVMVTATVGETLSVGLAVGFFVGVLESSSVYPYPPKPLSLVFPLVAGWQLTLSGLVNKRH